MGRKLIPKPQLYPRCGCLWEGTYFLGSSYLWPLSTRTLVTQTRDPGGNLNRQRGCVYCKGAGMSMNHGRGYRPRTKKSKKTVQGTRLSAARLPLPSSTRLHSFLAVPQPFCTVGTVTDYGSDNPKLAFPILPSLRRRANP